MSEKVFHELLRETVGLLYSVGVTPDRGPDGKLLSKIESALSGYTGSPNDPPRLTNFNPNIRQACPLCKQPDFNSCECPADEQMKAFIEAGVNI